VPAIGITDYFSIDGYKKVLEYKKNGRLSNFQLILPNIELRLDKYISGSDINRPRRQNYHVIFSDEIDPKSIEEEFLEGLEIKNEKGEKRKLCRRNIEEIGNSLKKSQAEYRGKSDYYIGCSNITLSPESIFEKLESRGDLFKGKYLLVLPEELWNKMNWAGQNHLIRKQLFQQSHVLSASNPHTICWALGEKNGCPADFIDEFGSLKPCIHGSDAHKFDKLCKPDKNRFCWIKSDTTFEGLKQILYEPEDRVKIQEDNPETRKSIYSMIKINILNSKINDHLAIRESRINLNQNLIAIIGGKGNGKTALIDLIANCFEDRSNRTCKDKNSFVRRIEKEKKDLEVEISFIGGDVFKKLLNEEKFYTKSKITYLPQGNIEQYSQDRFKLHEKIQEIIFNNYEVISAGYKDDFYKIQAKIDYHKRLIKEINIEIFELEEEVKPEIMAKLESEIKLKEGELLDKNNEIQLFINKICEKSQSIVDELKEKEKRLRIRHSQLNEAKEENQIIISKVIDAANLNSLINNFNKNILLLNISKTIPSINNEPQLNALNEIKQLIVDNIRSVMEDITKIDSEIQKLSGFEKEQAELLGKRDAINSNLEQLKSQSIRLLSKEGKIDLLKSERELCYLRFIEDKIKLKSIYEQIISAFSQGKNEILSNIDFKSSIYFDNVKFEEYGEEIFNLKRIHMDEIKDLSEKLNKVVTSNGDITSLINFYFISSSKFNDSQLLKKARSNLDIYNWLFEDYLVLNTDIFFNDKYMENLSMGQKGTVLLKIFLAEGDHPLFIDQPEENLDNKFVYEALVNAFREAKKKRQIIIATHNANLVVNTDAEQVIVADYLNNEISYRSGSIEDPMIRDDITALLEGGEEAFRKRERRYST
jgi:ABC-type Mn2+/Zn2+ transport system ATPase subunit